MTLSKGFQDIPGQIGDMSKLTSFLVLTGCHLGLLKICVTPFGGSRLNFFIARLFWGKPRLKQQGRGKTMLQCMGEYANPVLKWWPVKLGICMALRWTCKNPFQAPNSNSKRQNSKFLPFTILLIRGRHILNPFMKQKKHYNRWYRIDI